MGGGSRQSVAQPPGPADKTNKHENKSNEQQRERTTQIWTTNDKENAQTQSKNGPAAFGALGLHPFFLRHWEEGVRRRAGEGEEEEVQEVFHVRTLAH